VGPTAVLDVRTLFSITLNLCSSLSVRDQVPHPYKTKSEITVFRILAFTKFTLTFTPNELDNIFSKVNGLYAGRP
jgi:hypothetical protein